MSLRVVFDFGAVLLRWRPAVVLQQALPQPSADALRELQATVFQGYGGDWGDFDLGLIGAKALAERIQRRSGLAEAAVLRVVAAATEELQPQPAVLSLLLQLRARGVPCSYLSNMPQPFADRIEQRWPLAQWFDSGVFSGRVQLGKPDPAIFALAQQRYGSAAGDLLLVDDHPANVAAARAAGWQAHLFVDAPGLARDLRARGLLS